MARTANETPQIDINRLNGIYLMEGKIEQGNYQANSSDPMLVLESDCRTSERVLRVKYEILKGSSVRPMDYEIKICAVPSNLGRGINYYFVCPVSSKRAKILYLCYQTNLFVHRDAYPERIYYPTQLTAVNYRANERLDINDRKLIEHFLKVKKRFYQGKKTLIQDAINKLIQKRKTLDLLCSQQIIDNYNRSMNKHH